MLFRRREPASFSERVRTLLWPRRSFARSFRYYSRRVLRLSATPHAIAAGIAAGVFVSFTPFLGFHFVLAGIVAWLIGGNLIASALGTAIGNPLLLPAIWASTFELGRLILYGRGGHVAGQIHFGHALSQLDFASIWKPLLLPMTVGSLVEGTAVALCFYMLTLWGARGFQQRRRDRLAERARSRVDAGHAPAA